MEVGESLVVVPEHQQDCEIYMGCNLESLNFFGFCNTYESHCLFLISSVTELNCDKGGMLWMPTFIVTII